MTLVGEEPLDTADGMNRTQRGFYIEHDKFRSCHVIRINVKLLTPATWLALILANTARMLVAEMTMQRIAPKVSKVTTKIDATPSDDQ